MDRQKTVQRPADTDKDINRQMDKLRKVIDTQPGRM